MAKAKGRTLVVMWKPGGGYAWSDANDCYVLGTSGPCSQPGDEMISFQALTCWFGCTAVIWGQEVFS